MAFSLLICCSLVCKAIRKALTYLNNNRSLDPIIFLFSQLVNVRGTVRAINGNERQLLAQLEDGTRVVGQHLLTGKEVAQLEGNVAATALAALFGCRAAARSTLTPCGS